APGAALLGVGDGAATARWIGAAPKKAPARLGSTPEGGDGPEAVWRLEGLAAAAGAEAGAAELLEQAALNWALGAYRFERYKRAETSAARLADPEPAIGAAAKARLIEIATAVYLARDLVNTPASDLGPADLERAVAALAATHGASFNSIVGEALLTETLPMIHAVGRGAAQAPRLLDVTWGAPTAPKLTIVGKGVCFDTGGLNLKPGRSMRLMKKDMGGAAAALALSHMVMALQLPVRLRLLIPAVENSVDALSFRPGDVLTSRKGITVEVGDTDAEGRLVLADALTLGAEESPDLMLDFATLTGAARVALGPEIAPFYTEDEDLAAALTASAAATDDPLWRMPLWRGYDRDLSSSVADCCSVSSSGFAGSITAALFLSRFISAPGAEAGSEAADPSAAPPRWAHFDIYAWNPKTRPGRPEGGEAAAARAVFHTLERLYGGAV
ncbi:MAG: leucyl aminopeptidase family protein, partial [Pseudomonadota bacterium]